MNTSRSIHGTPPPNSDSRLLGLFVAALLAVLVALLWPHDADSQASQKAEAMALAQSERLHGIKLEKLSLASNGAILDISYRVTDPVKAVALATAADSVYVLTERQIRLNLPPLLASAPSRSSSALPQRGQIYYAAAANPDRSLKPGDPVTLVLGKFKAHTLVQ